MKHTGKTILALLLSVFLPALLLAEETNGVQPGSFHFRGTFDGNLDSYGEIFSYKQPTDFKTRQKTYKDAINKVEKLYRKADILAQETSDGRVVLFIQLKVSDNEKNFLHAGKVNLVDGKFCKC